MGLGDEPALAWFTTTYGYTEAQQQAQDLLRELRGRGHERAERWADASSMHSAAASAAELPMQLEPTQLAQQQPAAEQPSLHGLLQTMQATQVQMQQELAALRQELQQTRAQLEEARRENAALRERRSRRSRSRRRSGSRNRGAAASSRSNSAKGASANDASRRVRPPRS